MSNIFKKYVGAFWKGCRTQRKSRTADLEMALQARLVALEDFCPVGERFHYLGGVWVCTSHTWGEPFEGTTQGVVGEHLTYTGTLIVRRFHFYELPILIAENSRHHALVEVTKEVTE